MTEILIVVIMLGAGLFAAALALYAANRRDAPGAVAFIWLTVIVALWSLLSALHTATGAIVWSKVRFTLISAIPVIWVALTLQVTEQGEWLNRRRLLALGAIPAITLIMTWVNPWQLMWNRFPFDATSAQATAEPLQFGPWFWIYTAYSYALFMAGIGILVRQFLRSGALYRLQIGLLLVGILFPLTINVAFTLGWLDASGVDYTALAFTVAGFLASLSLFRYRMFDVVPVARNTLIDRMGDGMLVLDARDRIVDLNPAMRRILSHPGQVVGQPLEVLQPPELVEEIRETAQERAEVVIGQAGESRYYDLQVSPLWDRRQQMTGRLIVLRDVTRLKRAEETLRQTNLDLEAHVEELDAFAHTVAHDLKNPLGVLIGYSDLLKSGVVTSEETERSFLHAISSNAFKMANIIDELLLLASVRKTEEIKLEPLDMGAIVTEVQARLAHMIEEYGAEIILPTTWPVAVGRDSWVEEVWVNYVSNALKYGGEPPRVELGCTEGTNGQLRFWVQDNGPGLDREEQAQLFTQFTRLHRVRAEGHGLGLSIVQRITSKLGGEVGVESEPGTGSRFWFTLPTPDKAPLTNSPENRD
ncbi:MAG: sensor histidine kinase [Anaerolineales bacterium]